MDKNKAERFAQYLISKYGEEGARKKIQKILKTGKVDLEDLKGFAESEQKSKGKTPKDLHGAKLNYIKTLKHQCAEDEELVYYKKGGSVDCGCVKKELKGGKTTKVNNNVEAFKKARGKANEADTVHVAGKIYSTTNSDGSPVDKRFPPYSGKVELKDRQAAKAGNKDSLKRQLKQDLTSSEKKGGNLQKNNKVKSAGAGCITKFKKHRLGGSLNGIPFYQGGTPKEGITLYFPKRAITGAEAYMNDTAITDPQYQEYTNKANAYSNEAPTISNIGNNILNRLKASYYGNKAALKGYYDEMDKYSREQWNKGNYVNALFGSPFVPIVRNYKPIYYRNKPFDIIKRNK